VPARGDVACLRGFCASLVRASCCFLAVLCQRLWPVFSTYLREPLDVLRPAVSGGDPVESRPGFIAMLKRIEGNGIRTIIVETASRFARDLMVQEVGYAMLTERGIELIAADSPQSFIEDTPTARLIRQVLGAVSEFDKAMTVAKLRGARDRKRATGVKVEGRKSHAELRPEVVAEAKRLRRKRPKGGQRSYRQIANELFRAGHGNSNGRRFSPSSIKAMIEVR